MIFDKKVDVYRLLPDSQDADFEYYQKIYTGVHVQIQPESPDFEASVNGTFGRTFRMYCTQSGLAINDKIVVSGSVTISGMEYIVRGIADWNMPPLPHFEVRLEEGGV